jgi:hypothetical protein
MPHVERGIVLAHGTGAYEHGIVQRAESVHLDARFFRGYPVRRPLCRGNKAVKGLRDFEQHKRTLMERVGQPHLVEGFAALPLHSIGHQHTGVAQTGGSASGHCGIGIRHADHDLRNTGVENRFGAGRSFSEMITGLECDIHRGAVCTLARVAQ